MEHIKNFEDFNVQDMMSIPTSLNVNGSETPQKTNVQDMMSIPTNITKMEDEYTELLKPYYDYMKTVTTIKDLSNITFEKMDEYVGFSFVVYYMKVMILSDKSGVYILINGDLIPMNEPLEITDILENEK